MEIEAEDFLELVHGERQGWVGLPAKVGKYWVEFSTEWPGDGVITRRIDTCLRDKEDLYYSAALFKVKGRRIEDVQGSSWLWADLDEVHPTAAAQAFGYLPTVAVESSPGRYQALWALTRELPPKSLERLNRALSYALDADRGGWDLTQVLRLPGTRNFKYPEAPMVRLMWYKPELTYNPDSMWAKLKAALPEHELKAAVAVLIPKRGIPARAKVLLRTPPEMVVAGERSDRMWELECLLAESGMGVDEIYDLIWNCAWNKWRSVHSGRSRLEKEIQKAIRHVGRQVSLKQRDREASKDKEGPPAQLPPATEAGGLPFMTYSSVMSQVMEEPKWLVEDIWAADSHGIIGGEPKTAKTTLAMALALAVASGKPFLGKYPVPTSGPVLFVQEENAPWMVQDRLRKLAWHSGLIRPRAVHERKREPGDLARKGSVVMSLDFPDDIPFRLLNNYGFDLAEDEHTDGLWKACDEFRPKLVILDPLYLILGDADSDRVVHLRPFLKWLLKLRMEFGCSVILVHHMRKRNLNAQTQARAGQNLLGSAILHGWVDSALYLMDRETDKKGWKSIIVEREFRSMAPQRPIEVDLAMGEPGALEMKANVTTFDLAGLIVSRVRDEPGITLNALAQELEMDKRTLMSRIRGDEQQRIRVESGQRGRGHTHKLYAT
jgi:AAA domain/RepB DNA-primase N-terminal domain